MGVRVIAPDGTERKKFRVKLEMKSQDLGNFKVPCELCGIMVDCSEYDDMPICSDCRRYKSRY